ncbi:MAG TPA: NADH-quinone oxidoreductase subunit D [Myxococcales bacterium]|nr:NADH-quinone oxidoreductase subunit D [Myxococcales bacterium]
MSIIDDDPLHDNLMTLKMGPSHPAMHGTVCMELKLEGETIRDMDIDIGYLHRGFEIECEHATWTQILPYTDRLNYLSSLCNNVGYTLAVEKLLGIDITDRCKYVRMIAAEIGRIGDHLTAIAAGALELGAFTPMLFGMQAREEFYVLIEELCGARLTTSYTRVGGLRHDLPEGFEERYKHVEENFLWKNINDVEKMLFRNRIFMDRMCDVGVISPESAIEYGFTGPCLRATGVEHDVRKDHPYFFYDRMDFDIPLGHKGDNYDRFLIRVEEIKQSTKIIRQCFEQMEPGPVNIDDWTIVLPPKQDVYNSIEAMIAHFKLIMEGIQVPAGEVYSYTEAPNGELGFYIVSNGSGRPYRLHCRPPCFALMQGLKEMLVGSQLADIVPTFDTVNMIGGEIDR